MTLPTAMHLPINRKERFYTGTVLPMIVASDEFTHLHLLLELCGLHDITIGALPTWDSLQFVTEYSFSESVFLTEDKGTFSRRPPIGDTPDLVISGTDWLLVIEAKMFHNPNAAALTAQFNRQAELVAYWTTHFGLDPSRVAHVLLLPSGLCTTLHGTTLPVPPVTWQQIAETYQDVGPKYWLEVLNTALANYEKLVSVSAWEQNPDAKLTGAQIRECSGAAPLYTWMGRDRGLGGAPLKHDIDSGQWESRKYEVRQHALPGNRNWFSIQGFLAKVMAHENSG